MTQTRIPKAQLDVTLVDTSSSQTLTNKSIDASEINSGTLPSARLGLTALTLSIPGTGPANQTIYADAKAAFGYTINSILGAATSSGTIVLAVKINGTNVTSLSAVTISSSSADTSATGANTVNAGDQVTWVFSSNSSAADLRFTMKITRT